MLEQTPCSLCGGTEDEINEYIERDGSRVWYHNRCKNQMLRDTLPSRLRRSGLVSAHQAADELEELRWLAKDLAHELSRMLYHWDAEFGPDTGGGGVWEPTRRVLERYRKWRKNLPN
jgi:hypothetical protein